MRTRRTHIISVIAIGLLVITCAGCTSLTIPEQPVDLRGDGIVAAKGDKFAVSSERKIRGSISASGGYVRGPEKLRLNGSLSGTKSNNVEFEVMEASGGKAIKLRASDIKQPYHIKVYMSATGEKTENIDDTGVGDLDGEEHTLEKNEGKWDRRFDALQSVLGRTSLFPVGRVSAGHRWEPGGDFIKGIFDALAGMKGNSSAPIPSDDDVDLKVGLQFKGLTEYKGETCAVIKINISGVGQLEDAPQGVGKFTVSGRGEIYRSLDSYRNLKAKTSIWFRLNGSMREGGNRMSWSGSLSISITEKEEVIHKVEPAPETKEQTGPFYDKPEVK